jgi:hypothetical protein
MCVLLLAPLLALTHAQVTAKLVPLGILGTALSCIGYGAYNVTCVEPGN